MTKKHHPSHSKPSHGHKKKSAAPAASETEELDDAPAVQDTEPEPAPAPAAEEEALHTQLLRLKADFENYRKRMDREKKSWIAFASEKLILELLPVLDHFELGLADSAKNGAPAAFTEGFRLIYGQLQAAIEKAGVEPIDAEGQLFDPNLHEAISHMPSDEVPENHVMTQTRRGYKLGDKLLRAAQVVVSSGPAAV